MFFTHPLLNPTPTDSDRVPIDAGELLGAMCLLVVLITLFAASAHIHVRRVRSAVDEDQVGLSRSFMTMHAMNDRAHLSTFVGVFCAYESTRVRTLVPFAECYKRLVTWRNCANGSGACVSTIDEEGEMHAGMRVRHERSSARAYALARLFGGVSHCVRSGAWLLSSAIVHW